MRCLVDGVLFFPEGSCIMVCLCWRLGLGDLIWWELPWWMDGIDFGYFLEDVEVDGVMGRCVVSGGVIDWCCDLRVK